MPLPHSVARFNKRVTNRLTARLATRLPGFAVVAHTGWKTHRQYRTPVNVFQRTGKFIIALTYGPDADWVRNVLANGGCLLETRGRTFRLSCPRLFHDERRSSMPAFVRLILGLSHVFDFLELTPDGEATDRSSPQRAGPPAPAAGHRSENDRVKEASAN